MIAKCTSLNDIQAALQFARSHNLLTAIRCGGHNDGGYGMADGGITLDISGYSGVEVDPSKKLAWVKGGSLLGNLDRATVPHGLATTAGVVSHTGIGGLATGIGLGRLARKHGYTIDNIRGVKVMTPDGRILRADATENSDLHWGLRGGGSNFGIVTEFKLQLHEFDPNITSFSFTYPAAKAADAFKVLFELGDRAPYAMSVAAGIGTNGRGETTSSLGGTFLGSPEAARKILNPYLKKLGEPIRTRFDGIDYVRLQSIIDGSLLAERSTYTQTGFFNHVDDHVAEALADYGSKYAMPNASIRMSQQGGIANKVASDAMAFPHRDTIYMCTVGVNWADPQDAAPLKKFSDDGWDVLGPMGAGGSYANSAVDPSEAKIRQIYGSNYARLVEVKNKYDPTNFLHLNVNVKPSRAT